MSKKKPDWRVFSPENNFTIGNVHDLKIDGVDCGPVHKLDLSKIDYRFNIDIVTYGINETTLRCIMTGDEKKEYTLSFTHKHAYSGICYNFTFCNCHININKVAAVGFDNTRKVREISFSFTCHGRYCELTTEVTKDE